ncbi:MAG: hypothetical protein RBS56_00270 [Candidatus Gracilibacteria bacterium]|nr:hypothetical protein [Candidatus Gracilibacteria bacterium]
MKKLDTVLKKIIETYNPVSVFLYGSRARADFLKRSDFEIGILVPASRSVSIIELKSAIGEDGVNVYPFILEDFKNGIIDTPFQKNIYLRELISVGKTLHGEKVIENIKAPAITIVDLMQDLRFNMGYALGALISHRNKDFETASLEFYKSCLFGTRSLLILKKRKFALSYDEIFSLSKKLNLDLYSDLVKTAFNCRIGKANYSEIDIFENISYLNKYIEPALLKYFEKYGNKALIK